MLQGNFFIPIQDISTSEQPKESHHRGFKQNQQHRVLQNPL